MKFVKCGVLFLVAMVFVCTVKIPAIAQEEEGFLAAPWRFHVNLYGWLPEAPATISVDGKQKVPVNIKLGVEYSVVRPDDFGQQAAVRLQVTPIIPGLIKNPIFGM